MQGNESKMLKKNFFFIDNDNVAEIEPKLYGFCIANDIENTYEKIENGESFTKAYSNGSYVLIQDIRNKLCISQDFNGNYGLYLFQKNEYFAISNSFLFLTEKLRSKHELRFNYDYANALLAAGLSPLSDAETMVKEIKVLPRNVKVIIDKKTKKIELKEIDYQEHSVELNSVEGIKILDRWFYKWTSLINELSYLNKQIGVDLSGGIDSRLVFLLFLKSKIRWENVRVNSSNDGLHCHDEDFEIATQIAKHFGVELNTRQNNKSRALSLEDSIHASFYTKLCIHKQMYWKNFYYEEPLFNFSGSGGEFLRASWSISKEQLMRQQCNRGKIYKHVDVSKSIEKILDNSYACSAKKYNVSELSRNELTQLMYRETRCRHHFGKAIVEGYCANIISIAPLMDSEIAKLQTREYEDANLLIALIFTRYCPELLKFKFEGGREISQETIKFAEAINERFPLEDRELQVSGINNYWFIGNNEIVSDNGVRVAKDEINDFLYKAFITDKCKKLISAHFHKDLYDFAKDYTEKTKFYPLQEVYAVMAVYVILEMVLESQKQDCEVVYDRLTALNGEEKINPTVYLKEERSMLFLFPFKEVERGSNVIIYGAGNVGNMFYAQVEGSGYCKLSAWVDQRFSVLDDRIETPDVIQTKSYDYVVVALSSEKVAMQVKEFLIKMGVEEKRIVWKKPEVYL